MKTIGLIGGISWISTMSYYKAINRGVQAARGGLHSARCVIYSVEFEEIERLQQEGKWEEAGAILGNAALALRRGGADFGLICANTMHKVFEQVQGYTPDMPFLHIADATAQAIKEKGLSRVLLLGTRYTMEEPFLKDRLEEAGLEILVPQKERRDAVNKIIFEELCRDICEEASKETLLNIVREGAKEGAEGVILGCTELGLLVQEETSPLPPFDTAQLHAQAAVREALLAD